MHIITFHYAYQRIESNPTQGMLLPTYLLISTYSLYLLPFSPSVHIQTSLNHFTSSHKQINLTQMYGF